MERRCGQRCKWVKHLPCLSCDAWDNTWLLIWYVGRCGLMRGGMFGVFMRWSPHQPHPCPSRSCSGSVYNLSRIKTTIQAIQAEADETGAPWDHIDAAKPLERAVKEWAVKCDEAPAIRSFGVVAWRMWRCVRVLPVSAVGCWIQVDLRWSKDIQVQVSYFILLLRILSPITICKHTSPTEVANTNSDEIRNHILEGAQVIFSTTTVAGQSLGSRVG